MSEKAEPMDLRGNVALVVGAAGPVGAAVSIRLAGLGASVAVLDRRPDALADRIARAGGHVLALTAEVEDRHSLRAAAGRLLTAWERIDIVVTGEATLGAVGPVVAGYLPEAARTSTRAVANLVVLAGSGSGSGLGSGSGSGEGAVSVTELREQLAGQPVRIDVLPDGPPTEEVCEQVLQLIGRALPVPAAS